MTITRTAYIRLVKYSIAVVAILIILIYIFARSLNYARGPKIDITEPTDGSSTGSSTIVISGRAVRTSGLTMNGREISVDEDGHFSEPLIIFKGQNIITFKAEDQFGRSIEKQLNLVGLSSETY